MKAMALAFLVALVLAPSAYAAEPGRPDAQDHAYCKALGDMGSRAASHRVLGVPKAGLDTAMANDYAKVIKVTGQPELLPSLQSTAATVFDKKWSPTDARNKVWTACLGTFK